MCLEIESAYKARKNGSRGWKIMRAVNMSQADGPSLCGTNRTEKGNWVNDPYCEAMKLGSMRRAAPATEGIHVCPTQESAKKVLDEYTRGAFTNLQLVEVRCYGFRAGGTNDFGAHSSCETWNAVKLLHLVDPLTFKPF